jgi:hypothetical protein
VGAYVPAFRNTCAYLVSLYVCFREGLQLGRGNGSQKATRSYIDATIQPSILPTLIHKKKVGENSSPGEHWKLKVLLRPSKETFQVRLANPPNRVDVRCKTSVLKTRSEQKKPKLT